MQLRVRKWKRFIWKLIKNDVNYSYYIFKQADMDSQRELRRLRRDGLTSTEIAECILPWDADVEISYYEYKGIRSRKWQREAIKLSVPLPGRPLQENTDDPLGYWEFLSAVGGWVLTEKGIHHIRHEIREVQKADQERWLRWIMPLIAVLALIVSIISVSSTCVP